MQPTCGCAHSTATAAIQHATTSASPSAVLVLVQAESPAEGCSSHKSRHASHALYKHRASSRIAPGPASFGDVSTAHPATTYSLLLLLAGQSTIIHDEEASASGCDPGLTGRAQSDSLAAAGRRCSVGRGEGGAAADQPPFHGKDRAAVDHLPCLGKDLVLLRAMTGRSGPGAGRAYLPDGPPGAVLCPPGAARLECAGRPPPRRPCARLRPQPRRAWKTRSLRSSSCPPHPLRCGRSRPDHSFQISRAGGGQRCGPTCCPRRPARALLEIDAPAIAIAVCLARAENETTSETMRLRDRDGLAVMGSETVSTTKSTTSRSTRTTEKMSASPSRRLVAVSG